jgi:hypothetical protein
MHTLTRVIRQPAVLAVLGLTALYIALILLFIANFDGGCRESYPGSCQFLELDLPGLLSTVLLLAVVAVAAGICAARPRSVARGTLLAALGSGVVAIMVLGVGLSSNAAWEWRY